MKHGEKTRLKILNAGMKLWPNVTLSTVARECKMTPAAILYHYSGEELKRSVAEHAVKERNSRVIVQLVADRDPAVNILSEGEKAAHFFS